VQIVTDSGADLSPEQRAGLDIHVVPLVITLDGQTYRSGVDIEPEGFYRLLAETDSFPTTSQPSAGDFADSYRQLAASDPEILSIHISSGLSGTVAAAHAGAALVPEANVTIVDTKTLSGAEGWQVEAAARALKAGWAKEKILELLAQVSAATDTIYTLKELRYLIHGGRISHLKGLLAATLRIKPMIGVDKVTGKYEQMGAMRTFNRAVEGLVNLVAKQYERGSALRLQVMHSLNPEGAERLYRLLDAAFDCEWLPVGPISPVLGAHTGPSLVGVAFAPKAAFPEVP
jgi:DegV family protein with EDD domain